MTDTGTDPDEQPRIVVRDKRRIDPVTGEPRTPDGADQPSGDGTQAHDESAADVSSADTQNEETQRLAKELEERTRDLQRINAEYANYRKRSDREREELVPVAQSALLVKLLPVLDDIDRADEHGDLTGGFKNVADSFRAILTATGLSEFGAEGDEFDPQVHEAVAHSTSPDVSREQIGAVMRKGYRHDDRVLRLALVAVVAPE